MSGKLELIIGPMFSGKSTELIRQIKKFKAINKKILVIKPKIDDRYAQLKIVSHNNELYQIDRLNYNKVKYAV